MNPSRSLSDVPCLPDDPATTAPQSRDRNLMINPNQVSEFYGASRGWNMFDPRYLTPEIECFLREEKEVLAQIYQINSELNHLIEVGAGYGRYMRWAATRTLDYDGIDLVPWLIAIGKERVKQMQREHPGARYQLHHKCIANIADCLRSDRGEFPLVLFPFNCFGNLAVLSEAMKALSSLKSDCLVSTYRTDSEATTARSNYYANCGYTHLSVSRNALGTLITSDEGLHSFAYSDKVLQDIFKGGGFRLKEVLEFGSIGLAYHFRFSEDCELTQEISNPSVIDHSDTSSITIFGNPSEADISGTELLAMQSLIATIKYVSTEQLLLECSSSIDEGALVKADLPSKARRNGNQRNVYVVGVVRGSVKTDPGRYEINVEIVKYGETRAASYDA